MNGFIIFIICMGIIVFLSLLVVAVVMLFRLKRLEKVDDSNLVFNFASHRTKGCCVGYLKKIVHGRNGRKIVTFWVKDADTDNKDKMDKLDSHKKATVIVDRNKIFTIPKGSLSNGKNITFLFPNRSEELSECLRSNPFGLAIACMIEGTSTVRNVEDVLRDKIDVTDALAKEMKDGEWTNNMIGFWQRFNEETAKIKDSDKKPGQNLGGIKQ